MDIILAQEICDSVLEALRDSVRALNNDAENSQRTVRVPGLVSEYCKTKAKAAAATTSSTSTKRPARSMLLDSNLPWNEPKEGGAGAISEIGVCELLVGLLACLVKCDTFFKHVGYGNSLGLFGPLTACC